MHDEANSLKAHISFDNSGGAAAKRFKKCEDKKANMYGLVYKYDSSKGHKIDQSVQLAKVNDIVEEYEELWGNWQSHLESASEGLIWSLDQTVDSCSRPNGQPSDPKQVISAKVLATPNAIPSDCRFREDLIWIKQGNLQNAEQWK